MSHRRTGAGKARLIRQQAEQEQFRKTGELIEAAQLRDLKEQFDLFHQNLKQFAHKHEKDIKDDPSFRHHFQKMCNQIGVDPLQSSKGFWSELLGVGDFYYELGIQIIEICIRSRPFNGGLMELDQLITELKIRRSQANKAISEDDILRAIKTLKPLGNHYSLIKIGDRKMVLSIPKELDSDQESLLNLGQETGYITYPMVQKKFKWSVERIEKAVNNLMVDELCWIDSQVQPEQYWISSYFKV